PRPRRGGVRVAPGRGAHPAVAAARPGAADVLLEHDHVERRVLLSQCERRPEAGEAPADDHHVGVRVARKRRRRLDRPGLLEPPDAAYLYRRSQASESTSPRIPTSSSNSALPAISGGEIWITRSPPASARQIRPASNLRRLR